ncbi:hypothetical protein F4805DRAFT_221494 [Annulohypoxylon moriforme]|nr:hypothetical protein F4805DRAFT_221494 [Annulohypoxylon moriforme]
MGVKRTRSQTNAEKHENAPPNTPQRISSPNIPEDDDAAASRPAKKPKTRKPAPEEDPTPNESLKNIMKEVDETFDSLMKEYKPNPYNSYGVTADNFASSMEFFIPKAEKLAETSPVAAFNLVLDLGEHAYGDLGCCVNSGGFGEIDEPLQNLDDLLVFLINERVALDENGGVVPGQEFKVNPSYHDVGMQYTVKLKPNRRELVCLDRAIVQDLTALFEKRRLRRETTEDWAGNALNDLVETSDRIDQCGIGGYYFPESIDLLAKIKGIERPERQRPPRKYWERRF